MDYTKQVWVLGGLATIFLIIDLVFDLVFAQSLQNVDTLVALRVFQYVAAGFSVVAIIALLYFTVLYAKKIRREPWDLTPSVWWKYCYGFAINFTALIVSGIALIWSVVRQSDLPKKSIIGTDTMAILGVWFGAWAVTLVTQLALYIILGIWTRKVLKANSIGQMDLDFGIRLPPMDEVRPGTAETAESFPSQDPTLASPPRTPKSRTTHTRQSSSTRLASSSAKSKRKTSARSSMEVPAFPAGEAVSIDSAFDSWDTSLVHREIRTAIRSSPPTRSGLDTIPGSRSESPANGLDGPFLPSSPVLSVSPHAASAETAEALGWDPMSPLRQNPASPPPSSPPNFSRPTSRPTSSYQKTLAPAFGSSQPELSMQELIHPLFRDTSPEPAPVAAVGTMVTAAPSANEPITPKTLARIRSLSSVRGHWRAMPSVDRSDRPSTAGSFGSPGPSIVDGEEERNPPAILPGFVLSAGQRTSLVGYGKRKSRPKSQLSAGSRLSQLLV